MWWLYFDMAADIGSRAIEHSRDPGRLARSAYTYIRLLLVSGVILSAVADEFVVTHPLGHTDSRTTIAVLGGTALFLLGGGLFEWEIIGRPSVAVLGGFAALGALVPLAAHIAPIGLMAAALSVLIGAAGVAREGEIRPLSTTVSPRHAALRGAGAARRRGAALVSGEFLVKLRDVSLGVRKA
jgi:low temperature requirement protein LtrA